MSFTKIQNSDFNGKGALSLPDQPTDAPQELKRKFDEDAREVVTPKFNNLIDELEATTSAASLGATAPSPRTGATVQAVINSISGDLSTLEGSVAQVIADDHTHANKTILDGIDDNGSGKLTYNGSVVGETDYSNLSNKPSINSVTLSGNKTSSDLGLMPATTLATVATSGSYNDLGNKPTIPTALSDLSDDSTHRVVTDTEKTAWNGKTTVAWNQQVTTGQQIAKVTIDGTDIDVYAPTGGGGGGGGNVDSVNGKQGTVVLDLGDMDDTSFSSVAQNDAVVRNGSNKWVNVPLPTVALSGSYADLSNKPTIPTVTSTYSATGTDAVNGTAVASALGTLSIPDDLNDLSDVSLSSPTNDQVLKYNGTTSKWENAAAPTTGHNMIANTPESTLISAIDGALTSDDNVVSAYGIKKWSNADVITLWTTVPQGDDTVGQWDDDWTTAPVDRTGWIWHECLYHLLSDNDVEMQIVFDPKESEIVSVYAWRYDDDYQNGGVDGGCVAIKLNSAVQSASGVKVGIKLKRQRTQTINVTPLT